MKIITKEVTVSDQPNAIAPHACPACGQPAYIGLNEVQCTNTQCRNAHADTIAYYTGAQRDLAKARTIKLLEVKIEGGFLKSKKGFGTPVVYPDPRDPDQLVRGIENTFPGVHVVGVQVVRTNGTDTAHIEVMLPRPAVQATVPVKAQTVTGASLDAWAGVYGISRNPGETDDCLRLRLDAAFSAGPQQDDDDTIF